jgi:hypothetical protein
MKPFLATLMIGLLGYIPAYSQKCHCPGSDFGENVKMVFRMNSGQIINLCGWRTGSRKDTVYQGYELFICGQQPMASSDETGQTMIRRVGDTLILSDYSQLPIGIHFAMVTRTFYIQKYFFRGKNLVDTSYFRDDLPQYSPAQIRTILAEYTGLTGKDGDSVNLVAHRLFWAVVSGSAKAKVYLGQIKGKFQNFDGALAEEFEDTWAVYQHWAKTRSKAVSRR